MKNVLYMTGAVKNAGDFLIEKRAKALLEYFIPNIKLTTENRVKIDYSDRIDYLNSFDAILFPGGPIYQLGIYPNAIPFVHDLHAIRPPLFFIGGGGKSSVYGTQMSDETKSFFELGTKHGVPLGCRDILTCRFLKQQGLSNIIMSGCPAWYDISQIEKTDINHHNNVRKKICISEPANPSNMPLLIKLCYRMRSEYPDANILLVIHREGKKDLEVILQQIYKDLGITHIFISGTADGFRNYDDCDMHVGFRVHAHIYNLSVRNFSILINEDVRGLGVNQTLGLENINIERSVIKEKQIYKNIYLTYCLNESLLFDNTIQHVVDCIEEAKKNEFYNYKEAFKRMRFYFGVMQSHIEAIGRIIV